MKYDDLPSQKKLLLYSDLYRFREIYQWENTIIAKVLRRMYGIEISTSELLKLERKYKISCRNKWLGE